MNSPQTTLPSPLSPAQIAVLRKITVQPDFRKEFFADPVRAAGTAAVGLTAAELEALVRITPQEIDGLQRAAKAVGGGRADDNCTLVYAVVFAVAFALLFATTARADVTIRP